MNTLRRPQLIFGLALFAIISLAAFSLPTPQAAANSDCPLTFDKPADVFKYAHNGTLEFSEFQRQNGQAVITITNNSNCELPLALGSYQMMSGNQLSEQELHDEQKQVVPAQSSRSLQVDLPSCMTQIDLYHDPGQNGVPTPPEPANADLIGFTFSGNEKDVYAENDMFHFTSGHPYEDLDNFPSDDDDGYSDATPAENSRYCDTPPETCQHPNNQLPIEKPADLFEYVDQGTLEFSQFEKQSGQTAISITNNSNCEFPVALGVYKMFDNKLENQELFSQDTAVVTPGSQETVTADLPACMAQIDLLYDPDEDGPPQTPKPANTDLIGFTFNQNEEDVYAENDMFHFEAGHPYEDLDNFPNDDDDSFEDAGPSDNFCPADQPDPLSGSCDVSPNDASPGETVTWTADASGGTTPYTYQWNLENSDDDSNQKTVTTDYSSSGSFDGTVTVTDNQGDSINRTCTVDITDNGDDDNDGKGGGGGAILEPRDDGEVRGDQDEDFSVQCTPENDTYLIGEPVLFTAEVNGDIDEDDVTFDWSSDNNFKSENNQAAVQYVSAGTKSTLSVTAEYDNREETTDCSVTIRQAASRNGVRLDQVPYTGPADTARTVAFSVFVLLIALSGSYYGLRRFREDAVAVGIPEDGA